MRYLLMISMVLVSVSSVFADRICVEKSTGKIIEFQSGNAPLGTLRSNAVNSGYSENEVEEVYVQDLRLMGKTEFYEYKNGELKEKKDKMQEFIKKQSDKEAAARVLLEKLQSLGFTKEETEMLMNTYVPAT